MASGSEARAELNAIGSKVSELRDCFFTVRSCPSICDLSPAKRACISFGSRTRNYLAAVPAVDSKILVGR